MAETDNMSAYEELTNKITRAEFNAMFTMLSSQQPAYDIAIEHVVRAERGFVVVYTLLAKAKGSPINHHYQRCAFLAFNGAGECHKHNDIAL